MMPPAETGTPRGQLLERCVDYLEQHGFSDLSLRGLAEALDTSHRMLIYHFDSRDGLLAEVASEVSARHRSLLAGLDEVDGEFDAMWQHIWSALSAPTATPRLFFEIAAHALHGRSWAQPFDVVIVAVWVAPLAALLTERGVQADEAAVRARLSIGVLRGLLLDRLATDEPDEVQAAVEMFGEWMTRP